MNMRSPTPSIEVRGLTKRYGGVTAVDGVSFRADGGTVTGVVGPNGSGKTTTLRALLGLVAPDSGEALVDGVPYGRLPWPRRAVGAVLTADGFHPARRADDHLRVLAAAGGIPDGRVPEVLQTVGLAEVARRRVGGFSLGMRARLALAGALLGDPGVLVLDEPANGLDPAGAAWLRSTLRAQADRGRAVLLSSHALAELGQLADRVVVIASGRLRYAGPLAEIGPTPAALESAFLRLTEASA